MNYLYGQIALDIARERSAEAIERARIHRLLHPAGPQPRSRLAMIRTGIARGAATLSLGTARLARWIDACAASEVLSDRSRRSVV